MFDKILNLLIDTILNYIKPSTMNKCAICVVIVALPASWLLGGWLFDVVVAGMLVLQQATEYLYAKQAETQASEQSLIENGNVPETSHQDA